LYAKQRVTTALAFKDQLGAVNAISDLLKANPEVLEVAKYYVKIYINVPKDGFLIDCKQSFLLFKEAQTVNEDFLIKKHKYSKLSTKL
jgi:hypothetical protein